MKPMRDRAVMVGLGALLSLAALGCERSADSVAVVVTLPGPTGALSSATVLADYSQAAATLQLVGARPACAVLPPDVSAEFSTEGDSRIVIVVKAATGFSGPLDLAVCKMIPELAGTAPEAISAQLIVSIAAATDSSGQALTESQLARLSSGRGLRVADARSGEEAPRAAVNERASQGSAVGAGAHHAGPDAVADGPADSLAEPMRRRTTSGHGRTEQKLTEREREGLEARAAAQARELEDASGARAADSQEAGDDEFADEDEENDPDIRRRTPAYDCYMDVVTSAGTLSSLHFEVRHSGATGGWEGSKSRVSCTWTVGGTRNICSDTGAGRLSCSASVPEGFETPSTVVVCTFRSEKPVTAQNFNIEVVEALDLGAKPVGADMLVTSVLER